MKKIIRWWKQLTEDNKIITSGIAVNIMILLVYIYIATQNRVTAKYAQQSAEEIKKQFIIVNSPSLNLGRIEYIFPEGEGAIPLTPGKHHGMKIGVTNISDHIVHVKGIKSAIVFDTRCAAVERLKDSMEKVQLVPNNGYLGKSVSIEYATSPFPPTITKTDSDKMVNGGGVLYFEVVYYNEASGKWRSYIIIAGVKDHKSRESLLNDPVYYNENIDSGGYKNLVCP